MSDREDNLPKTNSRWWIEVRWTHRLVVASFLWLPLYGEISATSPTSGTLPLTYVAALAWILVIILPVL